MNTKYFTEEDHLHYAIVQYVTLAHKQAFWIHAANESRAKLSYSQMNKKKALGTKRGVPDLLFFDPRQGHTGLAIEIKTPSGRVRPEQRVFLARLKERGWLTSVVRNFMEAKSIIDTYYQP